MSYEKVISIDVTTRTIYQGLRQILSLASFCRCNFSISDQCKRFKIFSNCCKQNYGGPQMRVFIFITWYKGEPAWTHALEGPHDLSISRFFFGGFFIFGPAIKHNECRNSHVLFNKRSAKWQKNSLHCFYNRIMLHKSATEIQIF